MKGMNNGSQQNVVHVEHEVDGQAEGKAKALEKAATAGRVRGLGATQP